MSVKIRRATKEDCPRLMELIRELAVYERAPQEVTVEMDHFIESGFGEKPVWWAMVATSPCHESDQERVVGFALYYIRYSTWKGQRMYLEDIVVTQDARGQGIGKMLMESLIAEAKAKKFCGMTWQVLDWNEPAIRFYQKYNPRLDGEWINCSLMFES